jgi:hypothetical protein
MVAEFPLNLTVHDPLLNRSIVELYTGIQVYRNKEEWVWELSFPSVIKKVALAKRQPRPLRDIFSLRSTRFSVWTSIAKAI